MSSKYVPGPDGRKVCPEGFKCSGDTLFPKPLDCVAVKISDDVRIRDTKDKSDTTLVFTKSEWAAFISGVKKGEFDLC